MKLVAFRLLKILSRPANIVFGRISNGLDRGIRHYGNPATHLMQFKTFTKTTFCAKSSDYMR